MSQSSPYERRDFAQRALRATSIAVSMSLGVALVVFEGRVLFILLAGILFALILRGAGGALAKKSGLPFGAVLATLAVLIAASIAFGTYFLGAAIAAQASAFLERVPQAWHALLDALRHRPALAQVMDPIGMKAPTVPANAAKLAMGAMSALEAVGVLALVFFVGIYGAARPEAYTRVVIALVPLAKRDRARRILSEMGDELTRWIYGRVIAMAMVAVCVSIGLALMRVPLALPLGILAGVLAFVEYLGSVASAIPAMLLAFTRGSMFAVWVALLFTGVHVVEGYILTPLLARRMIQIPPAYMLAAQVVLGEIFGVAGLTFATPLLVVATILVRRLYVEDALGDRSAGSSSVV